MTSMTDTATPATDDRFRIASHIEIISELRNVMALESLLKFHYGNDGDSVVTRLLDIDVEQNVLIVDACPTATMTDKLLMASNLSVSTEVRQITIRFDSGQPRATLFEGRSAIKIPIPENIVRIQRRDAYRIGTPPVEIVNCRFTHPSVPRREILLRVVDLSVEGMALLADPGLWSAKSGTLIRDCRIDLPATGVVSCNARIVRVLEKEIAGKNRLLIGCEFQKLTGSAETLLQKYILELERERMARLHGLTVTPAYS